MGTEISYIGIALYIFNIYIYIYNTFIIYPILIIKETPN